MRRSILSVLSLLLGAILITGIACSQKTTSVQQVEKKHESQPYMESPGQEVIE